MCLRVIKNDDSCIFSASAFAEQFVFILHQGGEWSAGFILMCFYIAGNVPAVRENIIQRVQREQ